MCILRRASLVVGSVKKKDKIRRYGRTITTAVATATVKWFSATVMSIKLMENSFCFSWIFVYFVCLFFWNGNGLSDGALLYCVELKIFLFILLVVVMRFKKIFFFSFFLLIYTPCLSP